VNLFEESNDRFNMLVNVCWTNMFKVQLLFDHPILNVALFVDAMNKKIIFVKSNYRFLLYNCNSP
jgi:hypothetical protein